MRKTGITILTIALAGALASAALAAEPSTSKSPAKACKAELKENATVFAEQYKATIGKKKPFATCIAAKKAQTKAITDATKNAAKACKAERAGDASAFAEAYGTNKNGKNAFGKCVSGKAKELREAVAAEVKDARVDACKAIKKNQPADFKAAYKTLGACIKAQSS